MLTVKSDDVSGRVKTYEAIVKGEDIVQPGIPESFNVLVKELQSLGLAVELLHEEEPSGLMAEDDKNEELSELEQIEALVGAEDLSAEVRSAEAALLDGLANSEDTPDLETLDQTSPPTDSVGEDEEEALVQAEALAEAEALVETERPTDTTE